MPHIVLASKSPRRHELLRRMGITDFSVVVPDVEETYPEGLAPQEIVAHIARLKSDAAAPLDRKSTRLNSSHKTESRMPSSA